MSWMLNLFFKRETVVETAVLKYYYEAFPRTECEKSALVVLRHKCNNMSILMLLQRVNHFSHDFAL